MISKTKYLLNGNSTPIRNSRNIKECVSNILKIVKIYSLKLKQISKYSLNIYKWSSTCKYTSVYQYCYKHCKIREWIQCIYKIVYSDLMQKIKVGRWNLHKREIDLQECFFLQNNLKRELKSKFELQNICVYI